jgi:hypothetical protein
MKRIVLAITILCLGVSVYGQTANVNMRELINHVDKNAEFLNLNYPPAQTQGDVGPSSFGITFDQNTTDMLPGQTVSISGHIFNKTQNDVHLKFYRWHVRLPDSWTSSICFGTNCYSPRTDSFAVDGYFSLPAGSVGGEFRLNLYCPSNTGTTDSVFDYIKFVALSGDPSDTLSSFFSGTYITEGVDQGKAIAGDPAKIVSIYPSPLLTGNSVHAKVASPHEMNFSYSIIDALGREVGFGMSHTRLIQGDNTLEVSELTGLTNGSYTLKFSFGDGTMDSRLFQIMR